MNIKDIKTNPDNPRIIKDDKFKKLVQSIKDFPKMMELRPIIVDENNVIQGGNMRYKALQELGYKDIPDEWVKQGKDLTPEQWAEFVIKDNVGFGEWEYGILADWDLEKLEQWGLDLPKNLDEIKALKDIPDIGELEFADELLLEHNYIVLYFDNPMDWEVAQEKYGLQVVKSNDPAEKCQKVGIGRVVNGKDFL